VKMSFIVNYVIAIISAVLVLYFLVELNNESEQELMNKERAVTEKNKQLTKVNQELDRFVYSVSHDLRSPLSSIMGIINLTKYAGSKEEILELVQLIEGRVKAQEKFINEIISYSRNSRTRVERTRVSLTEVVNEVLESLRYLPGFEGIDFRTEDSDKLQLLVDRTRLKVILLNLISNAIKYRDTTKPKTTVVVSLREEKRHMAIHVQDNGLGIAEEHLHKIFDMFYRASETSTGSGLGLYIAQEVVEKMGGTLSVKSKLGEGTTFIVRLRA
jgi:signal transduction histidine kinase